MHSILTSVARCSLTGVDMKRMASKSVDGLFFAGEVLDIDGITGGYNLQVCVWVCVGGWVGE